MADQTPTLAVRSFGTGPRPVLALHCSIAHSGAWRGLAGALGDQATLTAPDMLSHGRSPDWDGAGDFLGLMRDAAAPLLTRPMHLVGHSFGAALALALALAHPDKALSLTMVEPVFFAVALADAPEAVTAMDAKGAATNAAFSAQDWPLAARLFNREWSGVGPRWPDLPEKTRDAMIRGVRIVPGSHAGLYDDSLRLLPRLDQVTVPVMLARGGASQPVMQVVTEGLARRFPDATELVIPDAGHMLPISHPAQLAKALTTIWSRTD